MCYRRHPEAAAELDLSIDYYESIELGLGYDFALEVYGTHGVGEEGALSKLRVFFGWSHGSQMPRHYARAYWEAELVRVWNDAFDEHVAVRREIESQWSPQVAPY